MVTKLDTKRTWAWGGVVLAAGLMLAACSGPTAQQSDVAIDANDIGGVVTSSKGPEAGVWVIAETIDLPTKYSKIVVTDDQGRFVVPDLPSATYDVWVRGYGLVDSTRVTASPGKVVDLKAVLAPDPHAASQYYPSNYWYALLEVPPKSEFPGTGLNGNGIPESVESQEQWVNGLKTSACQACHQIGDKATREILPSLGTFPSSVAAWGRRLQAGQASFRMPGGIGSLGAQPALKMYADWTDRIAAGEVPPQAPPRPTGLERNLVVTQWDYGDAKTYIHDAISTDRWSPTANANGPIYGVSEYSANYVSALDPVKHTFVNMDVPVRDDDTPFASIQTPPRYPSAYWGTEIIWTGKSNPHSPVMDEQGRVWMTSTIRKPENPAWCQAGSSHPSARITPLESSQRQLSVYDPRTKKFTLIDTCFGTHRLALGSLDHRTLYFSGVGAFTPGVMGWFDIKVFDETHDEQKAQGWTAFVIDTNGNGRRDAATQVDGLAGGGELLTDSWLKVSPYAVVHNPVDGSVWAAVNTFPGAILRVSLGSNPSETALTEIFEPPYRNPKAPMEGTVPRGIDVDSNGVIWTNLSGSSHLASFDRQKCEGPLNGPTATGQHCPEGWTLYPLPGPSFKGTDLIADATYFNFVDQFGTSGLGKNTSFAIGNGSDSLLALPPGSDRFVTFRVPYPLGFYAKGLDGRIDDPNTGWKGRAIWSSSGTRAPWHIEGGKGTLPKVVKFQLRPDPLAR